MTVRARALVLVAAAVFAFPASVPPAAVFGQTPPAQQEVAFRNGDLELKGFVWKPEGAGPFPALLWNHGSEKLPGWHPVLGPAFVRRGYVFLVPHRRGHGRSPGPYIQDQLLATAQAQRGVTFVRLQETHLTDQLAGLEWLKAQSYVDGRRLAVAGCSYGGIQTTLAAERGAGYRAAVNFAGAAQSWGPVVELRERLTTAVRNAQMPIFFIQAENDFDLTPTRALSAEMQRAGKSHQVRIYPPHGTSHQNGHDFCVTGVDTWGADVFPFLEANLTR
jgi:dienelactone hydrolase